MSKKMQQVIFGTIVAAFAGPSFSAAAEPTVADLVKQLGGEDREAARAAFTQLAKLAERVAKSGDVAKQEETAKAIAEAAKKAEKPRIRVRLAMALARIPVEASDAVIAEAATKGPDRAQARARTARLQLAESLLAADRRTQAITVGRKARDAAKTDEEREAASAALDRMLAGGEKSAELGRQNGGLTFRRHTLAVNSNEGCAVADVDKDGQFDVLAGARWYKGPKFEAKPLRELPMDGEFTSNNGDHAYDVNGDGWVDLLSGSWMHKKVHWYENPGRDGLASGALWKEHVLIDDRGQNEANILHDLDGDGVPEIVVNCWDDKAPLVAWKMRKEGGKITATKHVLGDKGSGHGMAIGDVNGDGRDDIVLGVGWYEAPAERPLAKPWTLHPGPKVHHWSVPGLVVDVNGDGLADVVAGHAHDYGLEWHEQVKGADGKVTWKKHMIDKSFAQAHALVWVDVDGNGRPEVVTGKRVRGHAGRDPGAHDPTCLFRYEWDPAKKAFARYTIAYDNGVSTGMQINIVDFNKDKAPDIAMAGKSGTFVLINERAKRAASK